MEFVFRRHLSLLVISVVSGCADIEKTVGYENGAVELVFNIEVSHKIEVYQISKTNSVNTPHLVSVVYNSDGSLHTLILDGGVESIGNVSAGNLSIRILSMDTSFVGVYILKRTIPPLQNIACYELLLRVRPKPPVIPSSDPSGNSITGIEDKDVTLVCRSTGGYPKPTMAWYRTSNQTSPLATNTDQPQRDDRTYQLEYTFRTVRADDGSTFICQSSYDPPDPLYMQAKIKLNLGLKPSPPILILITPLRESTNEVVIANCSSAGFKPDTAQLMWSLDGNNVIPVANRQLYSNDTFIVTAEYTNTLSKTNNGRLLRCIVNHTALDAPLETQHTLDVQFATETATLSGETSGIVADVNNSITLTCTTGSSNPPSNITWYSNNLKLESNSLILKTSGEFNGHETTQDLVLEAVRTMDGDQIFCEVHNVVNEDKRLRSDTKTLDLRYYPIVTLSGNTVVEEGSTTLLRCEVDSNPKSTVTWFHNDIVLANGGTAVYESVSEYRIPVTNRTDSGTYKCAADNGHGRSDESETTLLVKYTPDVTVTSNNVTINDSLAVLNCISSGKPAVYTYSEWQHIWPGYGRVDHPTRLGNDPVLAFSALTYEYSGIYICTVSNGVSASLKPHAGYGTVYLQVDTFPVITTQGPIRIYNRMGENAFVYVDFYSNRADHKVDCFRGTRQINCYSQIQNGDIKLPVFGTIVPTMGSVASISIDIHNKSQYGMYNIRISNGLGTSTIDIEIVLADNPQEDQSNTGAIVGGTVVASVLVIIGIVSFVIRLKYLRQRTSKASGTSSSLAPVERAGNSTEDTASGIHLDLKGHKDVYYNIERNVYDELQERTGHTHEYGTIDMQRQSDTSFPKNKAYENL